MIKDLKPGDSVTAFYIVRSKEIRTKKDENTTYLSLELGDASGRIFGSLWDGVDKANSELEIGTPAKVRATVIEWKGKTHLSIQKIRSATSDDHLVLEDFLPKSDKDVGKLLEEIDQLIVSVVNPQLNQLLNNIFSNSTLRLKFADAPGGKLWHHCYKGGLVEHTLSVCRLAIRAAEHYPSLDRDLLVAGALLHDIGKTVEFQTAGFIDYSDAGRLLGHISIGFNLVQAEIDKVENFPQELKLKLLHLLLSHQGAQENGSPVSPMIREAFVLYSCDELDSKLGAIDRMEMREREPGKKWSSFVRLLDRFIYFGDDSQAK